MREFCTYGSVRGASGNRRPYRDHGDLLPYPNAQIPAGVGSVAVSMGGGGKSSSPCMPICRDSQHCGGIDRRSSGVGCRKQVVAASPDWERLA